MNSVFFKILIVLVILINFNSFGQQANFEKIKVKNTEYYLYTVQVGDGLYFISKSFNVTQAEIIELNPHTATGLKLGEKIILPIKSKNIDFNKNTESSKHNQFIESFEHIVLKKETIFGICQNYNLTQEELLFYNPNIEQGLQEGMRIRIPKKRVENEIFTGNVNKVSEYKKIIVPKTETRVETKKFEQYSIQKIPVLPPRKIHKVLKKETLYSISKIYDVKIEDIIKINPGSEIKIKKGMELIIPDKKVQIKKTPVILEFIEHIVLSKETLYSISKLYNIDIEEIIKYNPSTEKKLKKGYILMIPKLSIDKVTNKDSVLDINRELLKLKKDSIEKLNSIPIKIAFLLPFMIQNSKVESSNERFIEFYSGSLLAINEAKKHGISMEIYCYDTEKSEEKIIEILNKNELKTMDFIIGPAYSNQISYVSNFSRENKINTLIPFSSKVFDIISNPYLIQFNPNLNIQTQYLSELIKKEYKNENIVFLKIDSVNIMDEGNEFILSLQYELRNKRVNFQEVILNNEITIENSNILISDKKNILFFSSDKISKLNPHISILNKLNTNNNIFVFEQNNWIKKSKNYSVLQISPFKFDFSEKEYKIFNQNFSHFFKWEATTANPRYDVLGYDLTNYFINLIFRNGSDFTKNKLSLPVTTGIQSQFNFKRNSNNQGFVNNQLYHTIN